MVNKIFWRKAAQGGTVIGLTVVGLKVAQQNLPGASSLFWWLSFAAFVAMCYSFTRGMAKTVPPQTGFSYSGTLKFVMAMMLFVGVLSGTYMYIANNTFMYEQTLTSIDRTMEMYESMPMFAGQMDVYYDVIKRMMFSPVWLIVASVINYFIYGVVIGLFTGAFAKINPNPFSQSSDNTANL